MKLPSLKNIGTPIKQWFLEEVPLAKELATMATEQRQIAQEKINQIRTVGRTLRTKLGIEETMPINDAFKTHSYLLAKELRGEKLTDLERAAKQEAGHVVRDYLGGAVIGFISPMKQVSMSEADAIIAKSVKLTRADLQDIAAGACKDAKKLESFKIMTKYPQLRQMLSLIAKNDSIPLSVKITDYIKDLLGISPFQDLTNALKETKLLRGTQETLYTQEKATRLAKSLAVAKKTTGEAGFYAEKGALKGELPKVGFTSIRKAFTQERIDELFDAVKSNPLLSPWEKITAREGLSKILGEAGGVVPTENEISLLDAVFGNEFTETLLSKRPVLDKIKEAGLQLVNIPRSIMSSFDLSFGLRQGAFVAPSFRKQFFNSWKEQFKWFGSENAFKLSQEIIAKDPLFDLAKESGVSFTEVGRIMTKREERFMSQWAEKIPIIGKGVRASGRAYTGFANKFRMDIFSSMVKDAEEMGFNPYVDRDLAKSIADFVNNATGRGSLGGLERAATALNTFFFSPRLIASRLSLLNPAYYITQPAPVRQQALKSLFTFAGTILSILGLAKLAGAEVGTDPRSADFLKIKIGNTRIDIAAGFQQYIRMAAQILTGKYISSVTGKEITLGEGYKPLTRYDILFRQIETKEAPIFSFITDLMRGETYAGKPLTLPNEIQQRFVPMALQDIIDVAKDNPRLLPIGLLGVFGLGIQTYEPITIPTKQTGYPSLKSPATEMPSLKGVGTMK